MGVKASVSNKQIAAMMRAEAERQKRVLIRSMLYCAEEITNAARSTDSYTDRTGNLRSSIGCLVIVDGKIIQEYGFELVKQGAQGITDGKEYAYSLAGQFPEGVAIVAVAGKEYASYVADKGYDVLDSAEELARKVVPMTLKELRVLTQGNTNK